MLDPRHFWDIPLGGGLSKSPECLLLNPILAKLPTYICLCTQADEASRLSHSPQVVVQGLEGAYQLLVSWVRSSGSAE